LADVRNGKIEGADSCLEGAWFEAVGVAITLNAQLVRRGTDMGFAFEQHGGVHQDLSDSRDRTINTVFKKKIDEANWVDRMALLIHGWCCFV
jgi:hypothetical protein